MSETIDKCFKTYDKKKIQVRQEEKWDATGKDWFRRKKNS